MESLTTPFELSDGKKMWSTVKKAMEILEITEKGDFKLHRRRKARKEFQIFNSILSAIKLDNLTVLFQI